MEVNAQIIKRLAFIKYLYQFAREQSKLSPPQNYLSVLMFHDSVELFLSLSAEILNISVKSSIKFLEYWTEIKRLSGKELTQKSSMDKLNRARVSLKHKGLYPNLDDIERFRVNTQIFFEENFPIVFEIQFDEISLLDFIQDEEVKVILKDAQDFFENEQYKEALECIGIAFYVLLENYKESKRTYGKSPFDVGEDLAHIGHFFSYDEDWDSRKVIETVKIMQAILKPLIFNLDYRKYIKFRMFTPDNIFIGGSHYGKYNFIWLADREKLNFKKEQVEYCFNFVIESAITLQQFDFEIREDFPYFPNIL